MRTLNSLITVFALAFASLSVTACATSGDEYSDEYADAESNATLPGKFELWKSSDGQFRFHLVAGNGRILLTSEGYKARVGALNGVLSVLENGVDPAQYLLHQTASGAYNLHLRAKNYESIGFTETYASKSNAKRAITACVNATSTYLDKVEANQTGSRMEVLESDKGFRFNLHAQNGEIVLSSESYTTKAAAWNGAFAVKDAAADDSNFAVKTATDNRFYFTLTADNGQVVGVSQLYTSKQAAQNGIASVKTQLRGLDLI